MLSSKKDKLLTQAASLDALMRPKRADGSLENPYSNGFEKIYALEDIDISTVRPMNCADVRALKPSEEAGSKVPSQLCLRSFLVHNDVVQGAFDFAPNELLDHFVLDEPLEALGVEAELLSVCHAAGKKTLRDIHDGPLYDRVKQYVGTQPLYGLPYVDYRSFFWAIFGAVNPLATVSFFLDQEGGVDVVSFFPSLQMHVQSWKKISTSKRKELAELASAACAEKALPLWQKVINAQIRPWMRRKGHVATKSELLVRLERLSFVVGQAEGLLESTAPTLFDDLLCSVEPGVYAVDEASGRQYLELVALAKGYFYQAALSYPLATLIDMLERELAAQWQELPRQMAKRLLSLSPSFCTFARKGQLHITSA